MYDFHSWHQRFITNYYLSIKFITYLYYDHLNSHRTERKTWVIIIVLSHKNWFYDQGISWPTYDLELLLLTWINFSHGIDK